LNQLQRPRENLRQSDQQLLELGVVGTSEASSWVPALDSGESVGVTTQVCSVGDIVESPRVGVENGVDEAHGRFAEGETLLVDLVEVSNTEDEKD
jgi:hypothetical protein